MADVTPLPKSEGRALFSGKYAGLPDIDESSADVFETEDVFPAHAQGLTDDRDAYDSDDSLEALRNARTSASLGGRSALFPSRADQGSAQAQDVIETDALPRSREVRRHLMQNGGPSSWRRTADEAAPPRSARARAEADANKLARLRREMEALERSLVEREKEGESSPVVGDEDDGSSDASYESETGTDDPPATEVGHKRLGRRRRSRPTPNASDLLQQLAALRADGGVLDRLEERIEGGGPAHAGPSTRSADQLVNSLREIKIDVVAKEAALKGSSGGEEGAQQGDGYHLLAKTASVGTWTAEQLAELDGRLGKLERSVGLGSAEGGEADRYRPLIPTLERLEGLVALLAQPKQLDTVSRRIKMLLADLEKSAALANKTGANAASRRPPPIKTGDAAAGAAGGDAAAETARIDALFSLLPRIEPVLPVLPPLVTRLRSLDTLHASAAAFAESLASLQASQQSLEAGHADMDDVARRVQESLQKQAEAAQRNWDSLQQRLAAVTSRLQALEK